MPVCLQCWPEGTSSSSSSSSSLSWSSSPSLFPPQHSVALSAVLLLQSTTGPPLAPPLTHVVFHFLVACLTFLLFRIYFHVFVSSVNTLLFVGAVGGSSIALGTSCHSLWNQYYITVLSRCFVFRPFVMVSCSTIFSPFLNWFR